MGGRNDDKLAVAKKIRADEVINNTKDDMTAALKEMTNGKGADLIIETSGSEEALFKAFEAVKREGIVSVISFYERNLNDFPMDTLVLNRINLIGGSACLGNAQNTAKIMEKHKIPLTPIITQRVPFEECLEFFANVNIYKNRIKAIVEFEEI